ncbi:WD domain, G-beta repeat/PFU (PLAA family ubiquitin binding) [Novymonas esmeraldas]|uniref:WD domain, G-beta repeat/PFU (PLAA family ubiquitin binding) n=1 Tax=Novymonas esmeraldas TaxID=1808958 RepID=A0AAW0ESN6_9TRYP
MSDDAFILQADGREHISDVRSVSSTPLNPSLVLTASRDNTAKLSIIPTSGDTVEESRTFIGHSAFVNYVLLHPGIELLNNESCVVTGSNDKHVVLWGVESSTVEAVLDGHSNGACCGAVMCFAPGSVAADVDAALGGDIISGDWAGVVIIFDHKSGRPKQLYDKHATAIRGVAQLTNTSTVISGSGDKTIHAWDALTGRTIQIFSGHKDVVQCVCAIDGTRFASAGNDCTVRLWRVGSESPVHVLDGHDSLIYSVCWSPSLSELYTASEDHTVRVWRSSDAARKPSTVQVIQHPCVVWSVAATSDGRLLSGGSDHAVRVWTRDYDHMASIEKLEALEMAVSSQTVDVKIASSSGAAAASGGLDVGSMPYTHEIAQRRGAQEGERLFARNEKGEVELYVWNAGRWEKVGVVVAGPEAQSYTGAAQQQREQHFHQGQSYDYLFDVNVEGRMLKLPYRVGDSVVETAKRFIQDHAGVVAQDSQEEIQNFLMAHVSAEDLSRIPGLENSHRAAGSAGSVPPAAPVTPQEPSSTEGPGPMPAWEAPLAFDTFNVAAAQAKVNALLPGSAEFHHTVQAVSDSSSDPAAACAALLRLYTALPAGSRFPATDALRYMLAAFVDGPTIVLTVLTQLTAVWGPQAPLPPQLPTSPAEWMIAQRLASCVFGRLSQARVDVAAMTTDAQEMLVWLAATLPSMTKLMTSDTPSTMRTNCRAATVALLRNVAVALRSPVSSLATTPQLTGVAERLALAVVQQSAVVVLMERSDSPAVRDTLRSLRSLLLPTTAPAPAWRAAVVASMGKSLGFSLKGIATGAQVEGQSTAAWLLTEAGL